VPGDKQASPILSEVESELSAEIKGMLRDRLMSAADTSARGFDIERDPKSTSPIIDERKANMKLVRSRTWEKLLLPNDKLHVVPKVAVNLAEGTC
jgi:hypothetical protein